MPAPDDDSPGQPYQDRRTTRRYPPDQRPRIEARHVDGSWCAGRLHAWVPVQQGWRAVVSYHTPAGPQHYSWLSSDEVRLHPEGH